jgi:hypothetical protein
MECGCKKKKAHWIIGSVETPVGKVPRIGTCITLRDEMGALRVRFAIGRMDYTIPPGLYAVGEPTPESPVFITANYKLTFDYLRGALGGANGWILVIDTKGINVWCAAGKGTFGTAELVNRVRQTQLDQVVAHRKLIVPQLGAPGISAYEVQKLCGFQVLYGPVRAEDIPEFLTANFKTTPEMRRVHFDIHDRIAVIPVELVLWFKQALGLAVLTALLGGISHTGFSLAAAPRAFGLVFTGWLTGGALVPILLPWLPGRAFSIKGLWAALALWPVLSVCGFLGTSPIEIAGSSLLLTAIVSFMALNFTGTSTYTSMSGVKKEMKIAIPLQLLALIAGIIFIVLGGLL